MNTRGTIRRTAILAVLTSASSALAQVEGSRFELSTHRAGLAHEGPSFGAGAWGDFDGDGDPDLFANNHYRPTQFFVNLGNGTFVEQAAQYFDSEALKGDFHGSAWVDFDNDGDQDLFVTTGAAFGLGAFPQRMFVQDQGVFIDLARPLGLEYPLARGRSALWLPFNQFDIHGNHDPQLDLIVAAIQRPDGQEPTGFFLSAPPAYQFFDVTKSVALPPGDNTFVHASDLSGDGVLDLLVPTYSSLNVYATDTAPILDLSPSIGFPTVHYNIRDLATGDFDGNGLTDVMLATANEHSGFLVRNPHALDFLAVHWATEEGLRFAAEPQQAVVELAITTRQFALSEVYIGSLGLHPSSWTTQLDPRYPLHYGILPHTPGVDKGIYLGIDPVTRRRIALVSCPDYFNVSFEIHTRAEIGDVETVGFDPDAPGFPFDELLLAERDKKGKLKFVDRIAGSGLRQDAYSASVVTGDFDNDGDLDLFVLSFPGLFSSTHSLYWNDGTAHFREDATLSGIVTERTGRADAVSVVDYDRDGFLDFFVTNGDGYDPFDQVGHNQLFHNLGNGNHWLEVSLVGTTSNRDGIGARVSAHLGGGRILVRERNGGMHRSTQDDQSVLHFGLGNETVVRRIEIDWPSGKHQIVQQVPADQVLKVVER